MLEYQKIILQKVSFSNELFKEELIKSMRFLHPEELGRFKDWVIYNFFHTHFEEIKEVFLP